MKILVTGGSGFIGYHLSKSLLEDGFQVLGVDSINSYYDKELKIARLDLLRSYENFKFNKVDIADKESIARSFKSFEPQKVVNLAAQPGVRYSLINPYAYMESNLVGFLNVIELCRHCEVENFIYASSSSVYGLNNNSPSNVDDRVNKPISLYGATKRSNELIAYAYSNLYGLHTSGLRYFTVYGPYYRPDMAIFIFTEKIIAGEPINVFNNGKMKRDFTYIDDIVDGTKSAIDKNYEYEIFNLGNNKSEKLTDMINLIEDELNRKAIIRYKALQPGDVIDTFANIDNAKEKLGYNPKTELKVGIPKFIKWYKEYYNV
tara:strand:- start:21558 stop:22511 length:954 start_codon:yes stop_codon:yes gene_type:complete